MDFKKKLKQLASENKLVELEAALSGMNVSDFGDILKEMASEDKRIIYYSLVCMLLMKHKTAQLHRLAAELLLLPKL